MLKFASDILTSCAHWVSICVNENASKVPYCRRLTIIEIHGAGCIGLDLVTRGIHASSVLNPRGPQMSGAPPGATVCIAICDAICAGAVTHVCDATEYPQLFTVDVDQSTCTFSGCGVSHIFKFDCLSGCPPHLLVL